LGVNIPPKSAQPMKLACAIPDMTYPACIGAG
jgi:hypothetical protein